MDPHEMKRLQMEAMRLKDAMFQALQQIGPEPETALTSYIILGLEIAANIQMQQGRKVTDIMKMLAAGMYASVGEELNNGYESGFTVHKVDEYGNPMYRPEVPESDPNPFRPFGGRFSSNN